MFRQRLDAANPNLTQKLAAMTSRASPVTPANCDCLPFHLKTPRSTLKCFTLLRGGFLRLSPLGDVQGFLHLIIARKMYPRETVLRLSQEKKNHLMVDLRLKALFFSSLSWRQCEWDLGGTYQAVTSYVGADNLKLGNSVITKRRSKCHVMLIFNCETPLLRDRDWVLFVVQFSFVSGNYKT